MNPSPSSTEVEHLRRTRWLVPAVAAGLVALVLAAVYLARPAYKAYKVRRGEAAAHAAEEPMRRGDWKAAWAKVMVAVTLAPESPVALRQAARYATLSGTPGAVNYWQLLDSHGPLTRDDRILYAKALLRIRRTDLARLQLIEILRADPRDPEAIELSLALFMAEGRTKEALIAARQLADENPDRAGAELLLARALIANGTDQNRRHAKQVLWGIAFRPKTEAFAAITELSRMPEVGNAELRLLAKRLPETQTNALLRLLVESNLRFRLDPKADHGRTGEEVLHLVAASDSLENRIVAADWLILDGQHTNALALAAPPWSKTNELVLQRRLQSLANLDRWPEVASTVDDEASTLDPITREIYRAIVASHQGRPAEAATHLSSAASLAKDNPEPLLLIATYAESLDQPRIAAAALQPLLGNPTLAPATGQRIVNLLNHVDDIPPMLQALDRLLVFDPGNQSLQNEQVWLRLVSGERLEDCAATAAKLVQANPDNPKFLASLALAHLRLGNPEKAYETIESHQAALADPPPRLLVVQCAAMGAIGHRDAARQVARRIPLDRIRTEERVLVREWLAGPNG